MLNFDFLEKGLGIVSPPHVLYDFFQDKFFSSYILLTDQFSWSDCLYFLKYCAICVLQLFVNQVVTSKILKLILLSNQAIFLHDRKVKTKI